MKVTFKKEALNQEGLLDKAKYFIQAHLDEELEVETIRVKGSDINWRLEEVEIVLEVEKEEKKKK